jgi:hypothetical protein
LEDGATGLPYDSSNRGENTSVSNIGIYLTSVTGAQGLGLISRADALARINRTLGSVEKLRTFFGFQQSWNGVGNLAQGKNDPWVSVLDSGNLCAGLLTVAGSFPETRDRATALFKAHKWRAFVRNGFLIGGYNTRTQEFNTKWHLDTLGTDAYLAQYFAVALGAAPPSFWTTLNRRQIAWEGETFLWPGWEGGGLFMQFISGLWLDLSGSEIGKSGVRFARAQRHFARTLSAPVWGWSACDDPAGGYLGWNSLKAEVVTPHACVLPIEDDPRSTVQNLRALEKLGARSPDLGFYDSVNWKSGAVDHHFLLLDQGMLFISLCNYLNDAAIRRAFSNGLQSIASLAH